MTDINYVKRLETVAYMAKRLINTNNALLSSIPAFIDLKSIIMALEPMEEYKIVICGSRYWDNATVIEQALTNIPQKQTHKITIIHGDCYGADKMAGEISRELGYKVIEVPAEWNRYGKSAGPRRNERMLDMTPNEVIAFHNDITISKGTANTIKQATQKGLKVTIYDDKGAQLIWAHR